MNNLREDNVESTEYKIEEKFSKLIQYKSIYFILLKFQI